MKKRLLIIRKFVPGGLGRLILITFIFLYFGGNYIFTNSIFSRQKIMFRGDKGQEKISNAELVSSSQYGVPIGIAIDKQGTLFIRNSNNRHVYRRLLKNSIQHITSTHLEGSAGIAVDGIGNLFLLDRERPEDGGDVLSSEIIRVNHLGLRTRLSLIKHGWDKADHTWHQEIKALPDQKGDEYAIFGYPTALTVGENGYLYVADSGYGIISSIDGDGKVSDLWGTRNFDVCQDKKCDGDYPIEFQSIALDKFGNIYMTILGMHAVYKVSPGQKIKMIGDQAQCGWADGNLDAAVFCNPSGVATDADGNVYIIDNQSRIRKISLAGEVSTPISNISYRTNMFGITNKQVRLNGGITLDAAKDIFITSSIGVIKILNGV